MIPVLFSADATDFTTFGIGTLTDTISCEVTEERNGLYECLLKYPVAGQHYEKISKERILKVKPNDTSKEQAFRIYRITKPLNGIVQIYAQHISYDLANVPVMPFTAENISPALLLDRLLAEDDRFSGWTDYSQAKPFSVTQPQSVRACLGGSDGSMLSKWHGEFEWDNYTVKFHTHRGENTGVVIEYGKNLTELEQDEDNSGVYTSLLPYAVYTPEGEETEIVVTLTEEVIPIISTEMARAKTLIKDFSDQFESGTTVTEDLLRAVANDYIRDNPLGSTVPTITVSFEPLWKQPEYSALLERVNLCDTVTVRHTALGVSVSATVIQTVYDTLAERYTSITLGSEKSSMITTISEVQSSVQKVETTVGHFPKLLQTAIGNATSLITGQTGGYVVLHGDESGKPYELLILDAPNLSDAVNVWRWNVAGLGFSSNGYNGPYETAITADGQIVADFITSGSLVANIIKAGVIQSQDGSSWWDLESGEVHLRAYATTAQVEEVSDRVGEIEDKKMFRLVISSSNGNIFKSGNIKTTLSATVFSWDDDITDTLDDNQFIWTRVSEDAEADKKWNDAHFGGTKSVEITTDDVRIRATFFCDLIDTATRESLL
jgi:phage minor structural protein